MYNGSERRKAQPSPTTTELTGDGRPWRTRPISASPLNRAELERPARHALTSRQKLMLERLGLHNSGTETSAS